jgi:hypothetical protein
LFNILFKKVFQIKIQLIFLQLLQIAYAKIYDSRCGGFYILLIKYKTFTKPLFIGIGYVGSKDCNKIYKCYRKNVFISLCKPICPIDWECYDVNVKNNIQSFSKKN